MIFEGLCKVKIIFEHVFWRNKNIKIFLNYVLGPLLGVWLFYSLYQQVKAQPHLKESLILIKHAPFGVQAWKFWTVIILTFINWGLEAKKWQALMKHLEPLSYATALKGVLSGVTLSLNTPNRMGEYGGRLLYVKEGNRIKSVSLSIAGSICQLTITVLMGCGGLLFLYRYGSFLLLDQGFIITFCICSTDPAYISFPVVVDTTAFRKNSRAYEVPEVHNRARWVYSQIIVKVALPFVSPVPCFRHTICITAPGIAGGSYMAARFLADFDFVPGIGDRSIICDCRSWYTREIQYRTFKFV
jgi:hypothetical protein